MEDGGWTEPVEVDATPTARCAGADVDDGREREPNECAIRYANDEAGGEAQGLKCTAGSWLWCWLWAWVAGVSIRRSSRSIMWTVLTVWTALTVLTVPKTLSKRSRATRERPPRPTRAVACATIDQCHGAGACEDVIGGVFERPKSGEVLSHREYFGIPNVDPDELGTPTIDRDAGLGVLHSVSVGLWQLLEIVADGETAETVLPCNVDYSRVEELALDGQARVVAYVRPTAETGGTYVAAATQLPGRVVVLGGTFAVVRRSWHRAGTARRRRPSQLA